MSALHRLIYISHSREILTQPELERILGKARSFNPTIGVTGLLLYHDGAFIQIIEGPKESLDLLMWKIRADHRHAGLIVMHSADVQARVFPEWSMGYAPSGALTGAQREGMFNLHAYAMNRSIVTAADDRSVETQVDAFLSTFREFEAA